MMGVSMGRRATTGFIVMRRATRLEGLIPTIRSSSALFKKALLTGDSQKAEAASKRAWEAMVQLFEGLRNEQEDGYLAAGSMDVPTGWLASRLSLAEQRSMISAARIDHHHPNFGAMPLRVALNKIAHFRFDAATYRVDGRGAHYLVLGGTQSGQRWVAQILVSQLCRNSSAAIQAISNFPRRC